MKTPIMLRSTHEEIVSNISSNYESKLKIKDQDITNLVNKNAKVNMELINRDAKIDKLEKEVKDLKFCLDACKKEKNQVARENINVMRTLNMNRELKKQMLNIINGESDITFSKRSMRELVMLL